MNQTWPSAIRFLAGFILLAAPSDAARGQNNAAGTTLPNITVGKVRLQSSSTLETVNGQLELQIRIHNPTTEPLKISPAEFSLSYDGRTANANVSVSNPLFSGELEMAPNASVSAGWDL